MKGRPIEVLIAKPGLDGHESGAKVIARALADEGMEVVYTGTRQMPQMIVNSAVRKLIREERDNEIINVIRASYAAGMVDFTEHLRQLVDTGYIDHETAYDAAPNPDELKMALKGIRQPVSGILG